MSDVKIKKKPEKPEAFIGKTFNGGKLKVVAIAGKTKRCVSLFKVTCTECSKDPELFPLGYFVCLRSNLEAGVKPCGCSKNPKWSKEQNMLRVNRVADGRFKIHGIVNDGEYDGTSTRLECECLIDGNKWTSTINNLLSGYGCVKCGYMITAKKRSLSEDVAKDMCKKVCEQRGYKFFGFKEGYVGVFKTKVEYECPVHMAQNTTYDAFVHGGVGCKQCWKDKQKEFSGFYGWYPHRAEEQDYLYVMNFNDEYIKVGRSFAINKRLEKLPSESGISNIQVLSIYTATHREVWDLEQDIHKRLKDMGFYHLESEWSTETFNIVCLNNLNKLLDKCGYERVY